MEKRKRWRLQDGERQVVLLLGDFIAATGSALLAIYAWGQRDWLGFSAVFVKFRAEWFFILPFIWLLLMLNNYDVLRAASWRETSRGVLLSALGGIFLYLLLYFSSEPGSLPRRGVLYFIIISTILSLIWRWLYIKIFTAPNFMRRVLVIGAAESGRTMLKVYQAVKRAPFILVGYLDDDQEKIGTDIGGYPVLGGSPHLLKLLQEESITDLIVAILGPMRGEMFQAVLDAQERGINITRMPVAYEEILGRVPINHLESDWLLRSFVDELRVPTVYRIAKRIIDFIGGAMGFLFYLLIFPWIALAILLESGRPVLYLQPRLGQGGRPFSVVKFRTMHQDAEADGEAHWASEGDPRTTRVGKILRKMHLDEFPQFWNVLRGQMSLIGPRPERPELVAELEKNIPFYRARLLTKPGITGWAQVNYGKGASVQGSAEKLEFDLYYIKHRSIVLDIWILLRTVGSVFGFRGV